ncbi:hypothetical protein [Croceibacterium ferulae]|uniref:hypothetical protein n=1 Tax=Croceibacterium ferulae TaxID=1854641 RepID=UPI000EB59562|nr:hypothetical protein [Croceibacterium ferulae]
MKLHAALLPAPMLVVVLAATLSACGPAEDAPARPLGEEQALERAEAMLQDRAPEPAASPAAPVNSAAS